MNMSQTDDKPTTCVMCGKTILQKTRVLIEVIDGDRYIFDSSDCVLFFKKFKSLYGSGFGK